MSLRGNQSIIAKTFFFSLNTHANQADSGTSIGVIGVNMCVLQGVSMVFLSFHCWLSNTFNVRRGLSATCRDQFICYSFIQYSHFSWRSELLNNNPQYSSKHSWAYECFATVQQFHLILRFTLYLLFLE